MTKINWKKVGEHVPNNENRDYPGQKCTPYVSCLVWVCHPEVVHGGLIDVVRWDTQNACWHKPDMNSWIHEAPYQITHFCDDVNRPDLNIIFLKTNADQVPNINVYCGKGVTNYLEFQKHPVDEILNAKAIIDIGKSADCYSNSLDFIATIKNYGEFKKVKTNFYLDGEFLGNNIEPILKDFNQSIDLLNEICKQSKS